MPADKKTDNESSGPCSLLPKNLAKTLWPGTVDGRTVGGGLANKMARERDGNKHLTDATKSAWRTKINKNGKYFMALLALKND